MRFLVIHERENDIVFIHPHAYLDRAVSECEQVAKDHRYTKSEGWQVWHDLHDDFYEPENNRVYVYDLTIQNTPEL
jgi:hypothetical protein